MSIEGEPPQPSYGRLRASLYKPDGTSANDRFGAAVALVDGTVAVGAPGADANSVSRAGAVYLATPDGVFTPQPIRAGQPFDGGEFGATLSAVGGELFVGAPGDSGIGRVYLVVGGGIIQDFDPAEAAKADPLAPARARDRFGAAIAAEGDLLAIGAPSDDPSREGRVFVYNRRTGTWSVLRSSTPTPGDRFGAALAFVDTTLTIGAPGASALFKAQNAEMPVLPFGPPGYERLGASLAAIAGGVVVGAVDTDANADTAASKGLVLRLGLDGGIDASFSKPEPVREMGDLYGAAVAATDTLVFVGVPGDDAANVDGGAVYAYRGDVTVEEAIFRKRLIDAAFATSLAAEDERIVIGAPNDADGKGGVYEFDAQPTPCGGAVCTALGAVAGGSAGARFGQSVALADGAMLIGAPLEPADSGADAGAAFLAVLGLPSGRIANPESIRLPAISSASRWSPAGRPADQRRRYRRLRHRPSRVQRKPPSGA